MGDIRFIGNAHIDPVWLWTYDDGLSEIRSTFRAALDRIDESDDMFFTCACASYYRWIEENDPELFARIKEAVAMGRWEIVGGWWVQPDCNMPSGESFARHALISQRYFMEKFGVAARVGYNADSFGHNGALPQILKKSGLEYYLFMRPQRHEKALACDTFWWESPDGTRVMTHRLQEGYASNGGEEEKARKLEAISDEQGTPMALFYGVGNHGGGPTRKSLATLRALAAKSGARMRFSRLDAFFEEIDGSKLPVLADDLQHHAPGCYSAYSAIKRDNRRAERALDEAERYASLACAVSGFHYPARRLGEAWQRALFNQFHDILCGCSIKDAYADASASHGFALAIASETKHAALQWLTARMDLTGGDAFLPDKAHDFFIWADPERAAPIVLFNPHPRAVKALIATDARASAVRDSRGRDTQTQTVRARRTNGRDDKWGTLFSAELPALGWTTYWLLASREPVEAREYAWTDSAELSNGLVRLTFEKESGALLGIWRDGVNALKAPANILVIDERDSDTWGHNIARYDDVTGALGNARFMAVENGPLRWRLIVESEFGGARASVIYSLEAGSSDVRVTLRLRLDDKHVMLKLALPVACASPVTTYGMAYGSRERACDGLENPMQGWVDVGDAASGITVINDALYGYSAVGGELRVTLMRGALFADHYGERDALCELSEKGEAEFSLIISPREGALDRALVAGKRQILSLPPFAVLESRHPGALGAEASCAELDARGTVMTALKRSEDGDGYVVRLCEEAGAAEGARLSLFGRNMTADMKPFSVETYLAKDCAEGFERADLLERASE